MPEFLPVEETAVAVVVGTFNPKIFQPSWLASQGLVSQVEADQVEEMIVHPSLSTFAVGPLTVQVTQQRLDVRAVEAASHVAVRDFVIGVLRILEHTPVQTYGINRIMHVRLADDAAWKRLADALAPPAPWQGLLDQPMTSRVTMRGGRPDALERRLQVSVEPSARHKPGLFLDFNESPDAATTVPSAAAMAQDLEVHWDAAQAHFQAVARGLQRRAESPA